MSWRLLILTATLALVGCERLQQGLGVLTHAPSREAGEAPAGVYTLNSAHSSLHVGVTHLGYSTYRARFNTVSGRLDFAPRDPRESALEVTVQAASVDSGNAEIDNALREELFAVGEHPEIRFTAEEIAVTGESTGRITGELAMGGERHRASLAVTFNGAATNPLTGEETLGFSARGTIDRTDWGLSNWVPAVGREVEIRIEAEFVKRDSGERQD